MAEEKPTPYRVILRRSGRWVVEIDTKVQTMTTQYATCTCAKKYIKLAAKQHNGDPNPVVTFGKETDRGITWSKVPLPGFN